MSFLTNFFLLASFAILAIALALGLQAFGDIGVFSSWMAAAVLVLFAAVAHAAINRAHENHFLAATLNDLKRSVQALEQEREDLQTELAALREHVKKTDRARNAKLVSEMKVLEALVQQLANGVTASEQVGPPTAPEDEDPKLNPAWRVTDFDAAHPSVFDRASDEQLLTAVRESLEEGRVDLYLQPIVSLPQRKIRHYEALTRLRSDDGQILMPRHYLRVAESAGLITTIDNLLLFRSIKIVRQMMEASRDMSIFTNISANSLHDESFFPHFVDFLEKNIDLAPKLIFEFAQDTLDHCGPLELTHLRRLGSLGFGLSVDRVRALDLDVSFLRDRNFRFVKAPVGAMLNEGGDAAATRVMQVKSDLTRFGVDLIAERIEDEETMARVVEAGVDFGQGYLFGEPRPPRGARDKDSVAAA